jgi:hypothetical protein
MNTKEFKQVVKSAKVDLKKEVTSLSYWVNVISKAAQNGDCKQAVKHLLSVEKLPKKEEIQKLLLEKCLQGFKFYSETENEILIRKVRFERDSNGQVLRENDKPIIAESWYERKVSFTFDSVWNATFVGSKTRVIIPDSEIK